MTVRLLSRIALLTVLFIVGGATAHAQLQSGRILGTVFDPQKAGIPGATVTVTNLATNIARTAVTDSEGNYVITPLDPGTYSVGAEVPGFQKAVREGLVLTVGQSARVELSLNLGSLSTEVQVVAEVPLLNTESATLSQVITNEQIVDLPLNGRGFHELARLTSGVALLPPTGNTQPVRPEVVNGNVIGGVAGSQTRFLLDGVDITEEHQGGTWIQTSVDALQEFSVQQNAYSAEFHGSGATFNVTTKSGGNAFHGSVFEFMRSDKFDSKNFFAVNKEKLERNQFGGTLGGPLMIPGMYDGRNKTFFFASYEGHRRQQGVVDVSNRAVGGTASGRFSRLRTNFRSADHRDRRRRQYADAICRQHDPAESHFAAGVVLHEVHPGAERAKQYVRVEPHHRIYCEPDDPPARSGNQLAEPTVREVQRSQECGRPPGGVVDARCDTAGGSGVQRRSFADIEFRFVIGPRSSVQPHVRRVPIHGVLSGPGRAAGAAAGRRQRVSRAFRIRRSAACRHSTFPGTPDSRGTPAMAGRNGRTAASTSSRIT